MKQIKRIPIRHHALLIRRAFTLIELVVVISVIVLLVGLTLAAGVAVIHQSERRQTQGTLDLLDAAVSEWELTADRRLTWGRNGQPTPAAHYDVQETTAEIFIISEMLDTMARVESVKQILSRMDPQFVVKYQLGLYPTWLVSAAEMQELDARFIGSLTILDAWGTPIYATHPGAVYDSQIDTTYPAMYPTTTPGNPDADGTERTYNESRYGVASSRRIRFVSAGPDGQFGHLSYNPGSPEFELTRDNLYSYPLDPAADAAPVAASGF